MMFISMRSSDRPPPSGTPVNILHQTYRIANGIPSASGTAALPVPTLQARDVWGFGLES